MKRDAGEMAVVPSILSDFTDVNLGDPRRDQRLRKIIEAFAASPASSLPVMMRTAAELQAFYRFGNNDHVEFEDLLAPHSRAAAARVAACGDVLVAHDGTEFQFRLDEELREGCERLGAESQGFWGAVSLAIEADSQRPLGVLGCETWTRKDLNPKRPNQKRSPKRKGHGSGRIDGIRWERFIASSEAHVVDRTKLIHVIDQEADGFPLFAMLIGAGRRFVIRVSGDRVVELTGDKKVLTHLSEASEKTKVVHRVTVPISRRRQAKRHSKHPARDARDAKLTFSALRVTLKRGSDVDKSLAKSIQLNVVCVREVDVPEGDEPIEWLLATSEPIDSPQDVIKVVDYYRGRWRIEEFFKTLKTSCAFEKRQLESKSALLKLLAVSLVVAWHVMLLRHASRTRPDDPATGALSPLMLFVLAATGRVPLREDATVNEALYAVAALGGHIKNNGAPGLITLSRGMERLVERVVGCVLTFQALGGLAEM